MSDKSEIEERVKRLLHLHSGRGGLKRITLPRKVGPAVFALFLAIVFAAVDALVIVLALSPGGSGISGEHVFWVGGFSIFCFVFLVAMIIAVFGRHVIVWDEDRIRIQSRCLFVRISRTVLAWGEIQDIGLYRLYCRSGSVVAIPASLQWGQSEGQVLMDILRESWIAKRPAGVQDGLEVVAIPQHEMEWRGGIAAIFFCWAIIGALVAFVGFGFGGLWREWGAILGFLPRTHELVVAYLVVPPFFAVFGFAIPLFIGIAVLIPNTKQDPQAFFFDNRIGRMIVSRSSVTAPADAKDGAAMPGYDYEDIVDFGVHTYATYMPTDEYVQFSTEKAMQDSLDRMDAAFRHEDRQTEVDLDTDMPFRGDTRYPTVKKETNYIVDARLANGAAWMLEEHAHRSDAQTRAAELRRIVELKASRCPAELRRSPAIPPTVLQRRLGDTDYFAWRGGGTLGSSIICLLISFGFGALGLLLKGKSINSLFVILACIAGILFVVGIGFFISGVSARRKAFALKLDAKELHYGRLPIALLAGRADADAIGAAFDKKKSWPLRSISGLSTVYTEGTWNQKVRYIEVRSAISGKKRSRSSNQSDTYLSMTDLGLGETIDFEQVLWRSIQERKREKDE